MIEYPDDERTADEAKRHGLPIAVLIRDVVRIVEVLNLDSQQFFGKRSVLAGSMALRTFGSPRFTVFDADFSTTSQTVDPPTQMKDMLAYSDDELDIIPADLTPHDAQGTVWQSSPVEFRPVFTALPLADGDRTFKADVSFRGLVLPGLERELIVPYDLRFWVDPPVVWVMDPHEVVAEKILGWCAHRLVKHYADLGFIAIVSQGKGGIELNVQLLRDALEAKLHAMRALHPTYYEEFPTIDALIADLGKPPELAGDQWHALVYLKGHQERFTPDLLERAVRTILVPTLLGECR